MTSKKKPLIAVDLFAGSGGMSLGAKMAGIDVLLAVEKEPFAGATYATNHPNTQLIIDDIKNVRKIDIKKEGKVSILFGGPPCQGFSTSNQRTRCKKNNSNWLFQEFIRLVHNWQPDWVVFENVRGLVETEHGFFKNILIQTLEDSGYVCSDKVLCASKFGIPQTRSRFFLIASNKGVKVQLPDSNSSTPVTVKQAIMDLPQLSNGAQIDYLPYSKNAKSNYANSLRNGKKKCSGHLVSKNAPYILDRYKHVPQGGNWENIPEYLMENYTDRTRCHTGIYHRLREDKPSVVLGNYRKNMLIHPWEDRGLSVREAARLQSFPDWYDFQGSIGFQQQQVGNAVPPKLAEAVFSVISDFERQM